MKITVLASGSKGNATIVEVNNHNILIDAGISLSLLEKRISSFPKIDTVLITHTHDDHIKGLRSIIKKYKPTIYTKSDLKAFINYEQINDQESILLDDISIKLIDLSHDVSCCGIIIKEFDKELVYITDTGYINRNILKEIENKDIYIFESNHDTEMLWNGSYPRHIKHRIISDRGHLSNNDCANYLIKSIGVNTKYIVLAHISEHNNSEELVANTIEEIINAKNNSIKNVYIAKQEEALETIEV